MNRPCAIRKPPCDRCKSAVGTVAAPPWIICVPCADDLAPAHPDPSGWQRHRTVEEVAR